MLKLSENQKNLGKIRVGQPSSFVVKLINPTNQDIEITNIKRGCGKCTQARMETNVVKANSSAPLYITFTPDSTGINRKSVTINNQLIFTFTANVYV